jgi:hypothetical protein
MELPGLATEQAGNPNDSNVDDNKIENLVSVTYQNDQYWLFHNQSVEADYSFKHHMRMVWQIVRYSVDSFSGQDENRFICEKGDIIKFGRVRFKIRKLHIRDEEEGESSVQDIA